MKKNFMAIASLLIAAMLLVVSCTQEVAPVDNGLVNVTLSTSMSGKAITVGGLNSGAINYTYSVEPQWTIPEGNTDEIVGRQSGKVTLNGANASLNLGYMSQGLWKFTVEGKRGEVTVLKGETTTYVTKSASNATNVVVFLKAEEGATAGLTFDLNVNDLANGAQGYTVEYIIKNTSNAVASEGTLRRTVVDPASPGTGESALTKSAKYELEEGKTVRLGTGYYRVTVSLKKDSTIIGGITQGFLVLKDDKNIKVSGYVTAADFAKGSLNIVRPQVSISLSAKVDETTINASNGYNIRGSESSYSSITDDVLVDFTATISSETDLSGIAGIELMSTQYIWNVDGSEEDTNTVNTHSVRMAPGHRHVSCTVYRTYRINNGVSTFNDVIAYTAYFDFTINRTV